MIRKLLFFALLLLIATSCRSQTEEEVSESRLGGPCEGCEAIYEYGEAQLNSVDTLPAFQENEPKLKLSGIVYKEDGKTPAKEVIIYIYHTDRNGIYPTEGNEEGWARRHGFIRGWIMTGARGEYTFYTFRPGSYPSGREPHHIHVTVKEPGKKEYYLDDFLFEDDPFLTEQIKKNRPERGGSGIVFPGQGKEVLLVKRDIVLGKNIPYYR